MKTPSNKPWWPWLLGLSLLITGLAFWAIWLEGGDFYHPPQPLTCAQPAPDRKPLHFIAFGDYGQGTPFQMALAEQMARELKNDPYTDVLLLGDNFYEDGDVNALHERVFEKPYAPLIAKHVRFHAAIGNHDDRNGHKKDQIAYFNMPGGLGYYQFSQGDVDFFILDTTYFVRNPAQQKWLAKALSESKARWKIVAGHHPLHSSGRNGPTKGLKSILEPLLIQNHVDLYLCGHDHDYERFAPVDGVRYVVSGGGGGWLTDFRDIAPGSQQRIRAFHFTSIRIDGDDLWLEAINRAGEVIDCAHWRKGE